MTICDHCGGVARWAVQNWEDVSYDNNTRPITRWLACGRHIHRALDKGAWNLDAVQVMDLRDEETV